MTKMRLTDLSIRQLPFTEKGQHRYFDEATANFGMTVGTRTKTFIIVSGRTRKLTTIGKYPDISLADARKQAKRLLAEEAPKGPTTRLVASVASYLLAIQSQVRPKTYSEYARYLKNPPDIDLADLSREHIGTLSAHNVTAWKVFANWCMAEQLLQRNPFTHIPVEYGQRSRVLSDEEIKRIWVYDHRPFSDIIKLCLLTGQRKGEVSKFCMAWVSGDMVTIPSTIAKNGREHTFPFQLLTALYLRDYSGQTFNGFSKAKARMDEKTGVTGYTVHDLRRTFSTIHARIGTPVHVTEKLLNHTSGTISGVAAVYNKHAYLEEMRKASLLYELHIAKLVSA